MLSVLFVLCLIIPQCGSLLACGTTLLRYVSVWGFESGENLAALQLASGSWLILENRNQLSPYFCPQKPGVLKSLLVFMFSFVIHTLLLEFFTLDFRSFKKFVGLGI